MDLKEAKEGVGSIILSDLVVLLTVQPRSIELRTRELNASGWLSVNRKESRVLERVVVFGLPRSGNSYKNYNRAF